MLSTLIVGPLVIQRRVNDFRRLNSSGPFRFFPDGSHPAANQFLRFLPVFATISFTGLAMVSGFVFHGLFGSSKELDLVDIAMLEVITLYMAGTISMLSGLVMWAVFYFDSLRWLTLWGFITVVDFMGSIRDCTLLLTSTGFQAPSIDTT